VDIKEFYDEKRKQHTRLVRELLAGKHPGQPELETYVDEDTDEEAKRPVAVYITSVRKREAGVTAGQTCLAAVWGDPACKSPGITAERIADGTHRIATQEEINKYLRRQLDQKKLHDNLDHKRETKRTQMVTSGPSDEIPEHLMAIATEPAKEAASRTKR
jgi:hypothetical protein